MALLSGFPPANTLSPQVRIAEKDLSFIAPQQSFHRAGLVGFCSKGPVNQPVLIQTTRQLNTIFGFPHPDVSDPYLIYASQLYLLVANELLVVRVAEQDTVDDEAATTATVNVLAAGSQIIVQSDTAEDYSFDVDSFFSWRLNGVLASKTLVVLSDDNRTENTGSPYTCSELVDTLNSQLDEAEDGLQFFCSTSDKIGISTTFAFGPTASLEFVSIKDSIYGPDAATGLGTGMTAASTTGSKDRYPNDGYHTAGNWDFTGLTSNAANLNVVIDGTQSVSIDNIVQTIDLSDLVGSVVTTSEIVDEINNQIDAGSIPGGFVASATGNNLTFTTLHVGEDARILVKSDSPAFSIFGFNGLTALGTSPQGSTGDVAVASYGIINGSENVDDTITFVMNADSPGIEGNNTQVKITNNIRDNTFDIEVFNNGVQVEAWGALTKDQTSAFYVETYLASRSNYISIADVTTVLAPPTDGTYQLTGGTDGIPSDPDKQDLLLVGRSIGSTGMYALSDSEQYDIDLIACPGHSSTNIVMALIDVCQNYRQDSMAIIDPPFGMSVNEIIQWQNGTHPLNSTRFDSDFAALYWPWVKIHDNFNLVDVWIPPSGAILAVYARSDFLSAPWYAPAGLNRGVVPAITDVFSRPTLAERDLMYGNRNAINPIVQFSDTDSFVVWGQKTLQRRPTALDRVNVRRMLFVAEKRIKVASRSLLFDPHDDLFRQRFKDLATAILRDIQVGRGINDFIIDASTDLNTPDVIDRNEFRARIGIQPTRAVEFMFIEFSVHRTGDFTDIGDQSF